MRDISKMFIYLLILNIYTLSIYSYENFTFLNNDNEINENLIEIRNKRAKQIVVNDLTTASVGSESITTEPSTYSTYVSVTIQSISSTIQMINQSTTDLTTHQTSPLVTNTFISTTSTSPTILDFTDPVGCNTFTEIKWFNDTCILKTDAQISTVNILRNRTGNATIIANALTLYIASITNANISWNPNYILSADEIDEYVGSLNNTNLTVNSNTSFIMIQQINQLAPIITLGAFYTHGIGGEIINSSNENNIYNSNLTAAAIIHNESLVNVTFLKMFIIDKPTTYENIDNSSNKTLASSVVVVAVGRNSSIYTPMNISLYFQVLNEYRPTVDAIYSCSYYDTTYRRWNDSGCTSPQLNGRFNRYECNCNHLSTFALVWSPNITSCDTITQVKWINGTCISKADAQKLAFETLNNSTNSTLTSDLLSIYISSITNSNTSLNSTYTLPIGDIDRYLSTINNVNLTRNTTDSFLMVQQPNQGNNVIIVGASFTNGIGGEVISTTNKDNLISSSLSAAAVVNSKSLTDVTTLRILIIGKPSAYRNIDNSTNKTLASSIILASIKGNNPSSTSMDISLYFQVLNEWKPNSTDVDYYCSFYDTNHSRWDESGCTKPVYNRQFDRYECSCNHLTSFALLFLPNVPLTTYLNAQDIASLVFQSISIVCFLLIIIHAIIIRLRDPLMGLRAYDLLPLISFASTTILFIFFIALGMTVYTKTSSSNQKQCFLSSSVLMFFVYFFLIFMFCTKTSIGYFNYLRFVRLFPQPPLRQLFKMLLVSFFISITWVAFAAGFNSNPSFKITQLYPYKLCWFTLDVVYYFLTIPVCLFLLINIIFFILVAIRIINHVRNATTPHQSYERMKRCVLLLLSSCLTQGIGWLFGVFLTFLNPTAGQVLGWFFVIFNGLEGFFTVVLYIIIRSKHMDEQKHVLAARALKKSIIAKPDKYKKSSIDINKNEDDIENRRTEVNYRDTQERASHLFNDLRELRSISWPLNDVDNEITTSYF